MELTINISDDLVKREPISSPVSFPVTESMRLRVDKIRAEKKIDLNKAVRCFLEKYLDLVAKQD